MNHRNAHLDHRSCKLQPATSQCTIITMITIQASRSQRFPLLTLLIIGVAAFANGVLAMVSPLPAVEDGDGRRLQAVVTFADQVLERGRDRWSGQDTPLFADGLDLRNGQPVVWKHRNREYIISNLASQQNLLRTLVALSRLSGEERYRSAAAATVRYHFEHLASPCGLLRWGGHQFIDLRTLNPVGISMSTVTNSRIHCPTTRSSTKSTRRPQRASSAQSGMLM